MKHYLLELLLACAPEDGPAQDAIEAAIISGTVKLTYDPMHDVLQIVARDREIMAQFIPPIAIAA